MRRVAVVGLGITGRAVAEALLARSIDVVAADDRPGQVASDWAAARGVKVHVPGSDAELLTLLGDVDAVVPAPGLPHHHPIFAASSGAGVPVLSEFDLAASWDDRPVVAVTGTDGKTTVVTLVTAMLNASGIVAVDVGNTDTPWVAAISDQATEVFVVEASSFRLGHSRGFSPQVAVWLNFGPDHIDAHGTLEAYERAKASIWAHLKPGSLAIANLSDPVVMGHAEALVDVDVETFGEFGAGYGVSDGHLMIDGRRWLAIDQLGRGLPHDRLNALAATAAAMRVGASLNACAAVLRTFTGLEHRVEPVIEADGILWVNDSKATTPHAASTAICGFDSVVLLAGGRDKGLAFDDMVAHAGRLRHVIALGEAAADIEAAFGPRVATSAAATMQEAIERAARIAQPGDTVLLSPACASFDWYDNYRRRGDDFRTRVLDLVNSATGARPSPVSPCSTGDRP